MGGMKAALKKGPYWGERITTRPLTRSDWTIVENLFGPKGACGGCWCMVWRTPRGGSYWHEVKGDPNRRAFKRLVEAGKASGVLAFINDEPVGWCSVAPRTDFAYLARSRVLQTDWEPGTWSVTCFYIPARKRRQGVASKLLKAAIELARANGATALEGYPVKPSASGNGNVPAAFAWTGVLRLFEKLKFEDITPRGGSRPIYRKQFRKSSTRK